jgi:glycosidase
MHHPAWATRASIYCVNVRQFTPEGTLRAFAAHLPRLQRMGVGIVWLLPIHPIGEVERKGALGSYYSVQDYRAVSPEFGTLDDLRYVVAETHRLGMRLILDWVANHSAWDNPLVALHPEWYKRDAAGQPVAPFPDWTDVIAFDYSQPALRQWMTESMAYWVREADIDGFRCDVAGMVPTDFWDDTRAALDAVKPVFMLSEWDDLFDPVHRTVGQPTGQLLRAFDATYAFRLHWLLDEIALQEQPTTALDEYRVLERQMHPPGTSLMTFTTSHDVNSWEGTEYERLGANALPLAVLAALFPGIPMVYSGQEAALNRRLHFFDRDPIEWADYPLADFYTRLLTLHRDHDALDNFDASCTFTRLASPDGTYAFSRHKGRAAVLVAVNLTAQPQQIQVPPAAAGAWHDVFANQPRAITAEPIAVPAHGWVVLSR